MTEPGSVLDPSSVWSHHGDTVTFFGKTARQTRRAWILPGGDKEEHYPAMGLLGSVVGRRQTPYDHLAISLNMLCELYFDSKGTVMQSANCYADRIELALAFQGNTHRVVAYAGDLPGNVDLIFCDQAGNYLPHDFTDPIVEVDPANLATRNQ